jgi:hypothetical protein
MSIAALPPAPENDRRRRRAAALTRLRDTAQADGLPPARAAELEGSLIGAFAINDLMATVFGGRDG